MNYTTFYKMIKQAAPAIPPIPAKPAMPMGQGADILKGIKGGMTPAGVKPDMPPMLPDAPAPTADGAGAQTQSVDQQLISTFKQLMNKVKPSTPAAPAPKTQEPVAAPVPKTASANCVGIYKALIKRAAGELTAAQQPANTYQQAVNPVSNIPKQTPNVFDKIMQRNKAYNAAKTRTAPKVQETVNNMTKDLDPKVKSAINGYMPAIEGAAQDLGALYGVHEDIQAGKVDPSVLYDKDSIRYFGGKLGENITKLPPEAQKKLLEFYAGQKQRQVNGIWEILKQVPGAASKLPPTPTVPVPKIPTIPPAGK